ncbi:MAG: hypothetical protein ACE5H3_04635 [Planctomycetota bacterium]
MISPVLLLACGLLPGGGAAAGGAQPGGEPGGVSAPRLERVTTAVPWPRGLVFYRGKLLVLARGRHRRAGGPDPGVEDMAGTVFEVDPVIREPVVPGRTPSQAVLHNAAVLARPAGPPFFLWDRAAHPPASDRRTDRPYCTLTVDPVSQNLFVCGFSGIDMPDGTFRKNPSDTIHRFDLDTRRWHPVEVHHAGIVPPDSQAGAIPNRYFPHHDPDRNPPPHGWLNGPDGCCVVGDFLYAVAKDNSLLVQYDLDRIRRDPEAGPPQSRVLLGTRAQVFVKGKPVSLYVEGHSALAAFGRWLYVGFRTTSQVVRFPIDERGDLVRPILGELVARFDPWDPATKHSADLMDIAFNPRGELFVSTARTGRIWKVGIPDPRRIFDGTTGTSEQPYLDLRKSSGNRRSKCGNIAFDDAGNLYLCSGNYDSGTNLAGVIYRVPAEPEYH